MLSLDRVLVDHIHSEKTASFRPIQPNNEKLVADLVIYSIDRNAGWIQKFILLTIESLSHHLFAIKPYFTRKITWLLPW
jgi:hypothetical protein